MKNNNFTVKGICSVSACGACPESLLNACAANGLEVWDMRCTDNFTLSFFIYEAQRELLERLAGKCMCDVRVETVSGGSKLVEFIGRHVVLGAVMTAVLLLLAVSSLFVWDTRVYGNDRLSEGEILRTLAHCGVDIGCFWPGVDRELLRSNVLLELPELAWMTVSFGSSRAEVMVSERKEKPEIYADSGSGDLIATQSGIVSGMSVLRGKTAVEKGAAVLKGETLVSGLVESITSEPDLVRSQGSVTADVWREVYAVAPEMQNFKTVFKRPRIRFALKAGKSRLNFYIERRKTVDGYDKIIDNHVVGIKGVFSLPLCLVVEKLIPYEAELRPAFDTEGMLVRLEEQLREETDGEFISVSGSGGSRAGLCLAALRTHSRENIALFVPHTVLTDN